MKKFRLNISKEALTAFLCSIIIAFFFIEPVSAQQEKLIDQIPLEVGNRWIYNYEANSTSSVTHSASDTKGTVEIEITGMKENSDSISWQIFKRRDLVLDVYGIPGPIYRKDSTTFTLVELKSGNHELYTPDWDQFNIFPFQKSSDDSSKFFRYVSTNPDDTVFSNLNFKDPYNPPAVFNYKYNFKLIADNGIVSLRFKRSSILSWQSAYYSLIRFIKVSQEPFLNLPKLDINISTLFGTTIDTTIQIWNDGLKSLTISDVTSSDPIISILDYSKTIQPRSGGFIKLHFSSPVEAEVTSSITITSNSVSDVNSFKVNGNAYAASIVKFDPSYGLYFGSVVNGEMKKLSYTITNIGNIPLIIDKIEITNQSFSKRVLNANVSPGEAVTDTVYFLPTQTSYYSGTLMFYSNASTSPDKLILDGNSAEGIKLEVNPKDINFGHTEVWEVKEKEFSITNLASEKVNVLSSLQSTNNGNYVSPFTVMLPEESNDFEINPGEAVKGRIRFRPINNSSVEDKLVLYFSSPFASIYSIENITIEGNFNTFLSQNYPNPFNTETTIRFYIDLQTFVSLKIYDVLGNEITTLVNEELLPGGYTKNFTGKGIASGVYLYILKAGGFLQTRKLLLLK